MGTSSAIPANLQSFVSRAGAATGELESQMSSLNSQIDEYTSLPTDYAFTNGAAIGHDGMLYVNGNQKDDKFVDGVQKAFVNADSGTLPDSAILATLKQEGVSDGSRSQTTIPAPEFRGAPLDSGFSDDPVCTATGHFLEEETDLVLPETLRVLGCLRTYSSLLIHPTSLGRGWYCWADARLVEVEGGVEYTGPDGQAATFLKGEDGAIAAHGAVAAAVERGEEGRLTLRWRWASPRPGARWDFAADGRLEAFHEPRGGTTTCGHDSGGRLTSLEHAGGRRIELTWVGDRITELSSSDGRRVRYLYDGPDLVGVTRPSGAQRYEVDDDGRILEIFDADGVRLVANTYDEEGRILTQTSPFGRTSHYRYLAPLTAVVNDDDGGPSSLYRHDPGGRLVELLDADGQRSHRAFDRHGNPVQVVDFDGSTTDRMFDADGNCTYQRHPDGAEERWTYDTEGRVLRHDDAGGGSTVWTYDDGPWPVAVTDALGGRTTFVYRNGLLARRVDPDGVGVTFERDADGVVVAVRNDLNAIVRTTPHPSGSPTAVQLATGERWTYEVDDAGRRLATESPLGLRTTWRWSPAGRLLEVTEPDGGLTTLRYGDHGEVEQIDWPGGRSTEETWDRLGNVATIGQRGEDPWVLEHDSVMQLSGATTPEGGHWSIHHSRAGAFEGFTDPLGNRWQADHENGTRTTTACSPLGRRLEATFSATGQAVGVTNDTGSRLTVTTDDVGRPLTYVLDGEPVLRWAWTPAGRPLAASLPDGTAWRWTYDGAGRQTSITSPDGGTTEVEHDEAGRPVTFTTSKGSTVVQRYDADGRLVSVTEGGATTSVSYDSRGRIAAITRPGTEEASFSHDVFGQLTRTTDPLGAASGFTWSADGRAVRFVDANGTERRRTFDGAGEMLVDRDPLGRTTTIERDILGRESQVRLPDGRQLDVAWDPDGRLAAIAAEGRALLTTCWTEVSPDQGGPVVRRRDTSGAAGTPSSLGWDRRGRTVESVQGDRRSRFTYDDRDRTVDMELPAGPAGRWHLDGLNRPSVLEHPTLGRIILLRDDDGAVIGVEAEGMSRRWQRDCAGQIVGYQELIGDVLRMSEVERDDAGRVVAETVPGGTRRYRYDRAGQLVGSDDPDRSVAWSYDPAGRLVSETVTDPAVGAAHHRRYRYDTADQLREIDDDGRVTTFAYDRLGRRISERTADGRTTRYHWDELGRLAAVERGDGSGRRTIPVTSDGYGRLSTVGSDAIDWPGGPAGDRAAGIGDEIVLGLAGLPLAASGPGGASWISTDWRGSAGGPMDPWGAPLDGAEPAPHVGYLGELCFDGLVWLRSRVYDPATRAFLSRDPYTGVPGRPGSLTNPYTYANNDPIGMADPTGRSPLSLAQAQAQMKDWRTSHVGEIIVGTAGILAAGAVIVLTDGAATPLVYGAIAGGLAGGGGTALSEAIDGKPIDPFAIYQSVGVGAFLGASGTDTALEADDGTTVARPSLTSRFSTLLKENGVPTPRLVANAATGTASGALTTAGSNNFSTSGSNLIKDLVGGGEGGAAGAAFTWVSIPKSAFSGAAYSDGVTPETDFNELAKSDPAAWWKVSRQAGNINRVTTTPLKPLNTGAATGVETPVYHALNPSAARTGSGSFAVVPRETPFHHYLNGHGHR